MGTVAWWLGCLISWGETQKLLSSRRNIYSFIFINIFLKSYIQFCLFGTGIDIKYGGGIWKYASVCLQLHPAGVCSEPSACRQTEDGSSVRSINPITEPRQTHTHTLHCTHTHTHTPSVIHLRRDLNSTDSHKWILSKHMQTVLSTHCIVIVTRDCLLGFYHLPGVWGLWTSAWPVLYLWPRYRSASMDWLVTFNSMKKAEELITLLVSWNWLPLDPSRYAPSTSSSLILFV